MRLSLLLLALLALPACDSYNNGYDDGYGDGQGNAPASTATVVDFSLDATPVRRLVGHAHRVLPLARHLIDSGDAQRCRAGTRDGRRRGARDALHQELPRHQPVCPTDPTYSALPISRGFSQLVLTNGPNGTTQTINVVGYTASYEFSFDNNDLYFDVVSSEPGSSFSIVRVAL